MTGKLGLWTLAVFVAGNVCALLINSTTAAERPGVMSAEIKTPPLSARSHYQCHPESMKAVAVASKWSRVACRRPTGGA
jgi:hypothetical protein